MIFLDRQLQHENVKYWSVYILQNALNYGKRAIPGKCAILWKNWIPGKGAITWKWNLLEIANPGKCAILWKKCHSWKMRYIIEKLLILENALYYGKNAIHGKGTITLKWHLLEEGNPAKCAILWKKCYSWKIRYIMENLLFLEKELKHENEIYWR